MVGRVEIIWPALEDRYSEPSGAERTREPDRDAGLADTAGRASYDQARYGNDLGHSDSFRALECIINGLSRQVSSRSWIGQDSR
jgi:hypothetical protein